MGAQEWLDFADGIKGMIVTNPGRKPAAIRVDQVSDIFSSLQCFFMVMKLWSCMTHYDL